jgi:hypothetical protein
MTDTKLTDTNKSYTFPFDTCEKPREKGIAQPYSVFVNIINCIIVFYFLCQTKNKYTFSLLFSILCFEMFHTFSHCIHIKSNLQINITHILSYFINFSFLYLFYNYTKKIPSILFIIYYILLICFDIYSFIYFNVVFYILSQALLFLSVLIYYYKLMPIKIKKNMYLFIFLTFLVVILFINEKYNCKKMLSLFPHFPYNILIEIVGIVLFYLISSSFYNL